MATSIRREKNDIAQWIFAQIVEERGGRFLKQVTTEIASKEAVTYVEVDKEVALEKIRQSLRQSLNHYTNNHKSNAIATAMTATATSSKKNGQTAETATTTSTSKPQHTPTKTIPSTSSSSSVAAATAAASKTTKKTQATNHHQRSRPLPSPTGKEELVRYKLILSYDGTRYKGWQRQSSSTSVQDSFTTTTDVVENQQKSSSSSSCTNTNANTSKHRRQHPNANLKKRKHDEMGKVVTIPLTIQESLEDALEMMYYHSHSLDRPSLQVRSAGRTDAGVHARGQVVVVSLPTPTNGNDDNNNNDNNVSLHLWQLRKSINSRLPRDISVDAIFLCDDPTFDPRKDVVLKQYSYTLRYFRRHGTDSSSSSSSFKGGPELLRSAFDNDRLWLVPWPLDDTKMDRYCQMLTGDHDFSAFVHKSARDIRDNTSKQVTRFECIRIPTVTTTALQGDDVDDDGAMTACEVRFEVEARGFGRSQVRNFIGFIVDLCRGAIQEYDSVEHWLWKYKTELVAKQINAAPASGLCLEWVQYASKS